MSRARVLTVLRLLALAAIGFAIAIPFVWMVSTSLKPRAEADSLNLVPAEPTLRNYPIVLDIVPDPVTKRYFGMHYARWYLNSILVASAVTLLQVLTSAMAAYAFSRIQWRGRDTVFLLYLATMMVPWILTVIPNFQIMVWLGFVDSYRGLVLPLAFSAFGTFLLRQFMLSIPPSLDEAARIDGAGHWQIFWEVIMPLARPGLIALAIITFLGVYRTLFWPLIMLDTEELYTLSVGMLALDSSQGRQTELIMAATVMNVVPLIIVFIVFQRFLVKGIQLGAVKG